MEAKIYIQINSGFKKETVFDTDLTVLTVSVEIKTTNPQTPK